MPLMLSRDASSFNSPTYCDDAESRPPKAETTGGVFPDCFEADCPTTRIRLQLGKIMGFPDELAHKRSGPTGKVPLSPQHFPRSVADKSLASSVRIE